MNDVCHAARDRPVSVRLWYGFGKRHSRMSERGDWGSGVAKVGPVGDAAMVGLLLNQGLTLVMVASFKGEKKIERLAAKHRPHL